MSNLHETFAPILRFAADERFFPMRVEDFCSYCALYAKDQSAPLARPGTVSPSQLARHARSPQVFLRSVTKGPFHGPDVAAHWGKQALELVCQMTPTGTSWTEGLARTAYRWFSPKTKGATQLFWWNRLLAPMLERADQEKQDLPRLILPEETRNDATEKYASRGQRAGYTYYYRQVRDGDCLCLQYWFFYSYNDWGRGFNGMNDHEGDWESLMLFFDLDAAGRPLEPPAYVTFVGHHSRITKPWDHHDVERVGTHVIGNVAAGSHATYPEAKPYPIMELYGLTDHATADGATIDHGQWVHRIALDDVPWLSDYQGSWGTRYWLPLKRAKTILTVLAPTSPVLRLINPAVPQEIELPGVSAPHGPMIGDASQERPQWRGPAAWAGVPPD